MSRLKPVETRSRVMPALLAIALVTVVFAILMVRLEVTEEGYRLSELQTEITQQQELNRRLKLQAAELSSHQKLRALAAKFHLGQPQPGQVVMVP